MEIRNAARLLCNICLTQRFNLHGSLQSTTEAILLTITWNNLSIVNHHSVVIGLLSALLPTAKSSLLVQLLTVDIRWHVQSFCWQLQQQTEEVNRLRSGKKNETAKGHTNLPMKAAVAHAPAYLTVAQLSKALGCWPSLTAHFYGRLSKFAIILSLRHDY